MPAKLVTYGYYPGVLAGSLLLGIAMVEAGFTSTTILVTSSLLFGVTTFLLERAYAESQLWRLEAIEARTDILHGLLSNTIPTALFRALGYTAIVAISHAIDQALGRPLWPAQWPLLTQFALALVVVEAVSYGIHRFLHRSRLWPLHAVHHCSPRMYFLLALRKHPLQAFITYGGRLSVLWLLGIPADTLTLLLVFTGANSYVQHANIELRTGPLGWVFATPELHRLHHSRRESELDTNFGDVLIIWDIVFGTRRQPNHGTELHSHVGLPDIEVPQTYSMHLKLPFVWSRLHAA